MISLFHLISAVVALLSGAIVLAAPKGTHFHKRMGYVFALSLVLVNLTAAFIFNLTGKPNFLHGFIFLSLISLSYGMWAAVRRTGDQWLSLHVRGMNGAALGVWAAGFAELVVRVAPRHLSAQQIIWMAIGIGCLFFFLIGFLNHYFSKRLHRYPSIPIHREKLKG